ncbi:ubiquitin elongating factor core-domain-containing protein [Neocallimastix lanati (nom. inval.)]|nr:ubiquitin elongating factor core-domain-containing protein [Neocallimastix sp. JGI-2020a]
MIEQNEADQDSIRQKRLLRLAQLEAQNENQNVNEKENSESKEAKKTKKEVKDEPKSTEPKTVTPIAKPNAFSSLASPKLTKNSSPSPINRKKKNKMEAIVSFLSQDEDDWDDQQYKKIFRCSLKENESDENGQLKYLKELSEDLISEDLPLKFTTSIVERLLVARLSLDENADDNATPLFDYLVGCWVELCEVQRKTNKLLLEKDITEMQKKDLTDKVKERIGRLNTAKELIVSYSGFVISTLAEMFPQSERALELGPKCIAEKLMHCNAFELENQLPTLFFDEFIKRFSDNLEEIFEPILKHIMDEMNKQNLNKNYLPPLNAASRLLANKSIAAMVPTFDYWNPETTIAREIEDKSFLGAFYSKVSAFPDSDSGISQAYFSNRNTFSYSTSYENNINGFEIGTRNPDDVKASMNNLRTVVENVQSTLYSMTMSIIRANPTAREAVLKFFGDTITKNHSREKIQIDRKEVSTDGLMYSLNRVCHKLCEPFLDPGYKKIGLIDLDYLTYTNRIDITEHTRILFDLNQSKEYTEKWNKDHPEKPKPNFVTEMFYLTMAVYHYGFLSTVRFYQRMVTQIEEIRKQVKKMNAEKNSGAWTNLGIRRIVNEQLLIRYQTQLDVMIDHKLAMDAILLNKTVLIDVYKFYNLVMTWIIRLILIKSGMVEPTSNINWATLARGDNFGNIDLRILPDEAPDAFKALPEWIIDDICEFLVFICRNQATIFENVSRDELMTFIMILMKHANYIKNPYLKAKFAEILYCFTVPLYRDALGHTSGRLDLIFEMHPLAKDLLVEDLMKFYIDIEQTGMHSQFYDKFNIRYNISQVLKCIWKDPSHKMQIVKQSRNTSFFVHFANLLMNDTTYLLDEGLAKLAEIHVIQKEMANVQRWNEESEQYRAERENLLRVDERQAISYMALSNETVHMLNYMTSDPQIVQPFMEPEIVERLAAMMDYNLTALVGPKCTELKVADPEKYRFNPKKLLTELIDIYLHLGTRKEFIAAVARDGRSYRKEIFLKAQHILKKNALKGPNDITKLSNFVNNVEEELKNINLEDEMDQDVPDEFLDPLLYTLMDDPVILPSSHITVDRSTIKSHLLSDSHDPFNRQPLTIDMVTPNVELKAKIDAYKKERQQKKKNINQ